MSGLDIGALDELVTFERKVPGHGVMRAGSDQWETVVADLWASVVDIQPSRTEKIAEGINIAARPARVRIRYREGLTADMRIRHGDRLMSIVGGPATLGRRDGIEFLVEDYSTQGGGR